MPSEFVIPTTRPAPATTCAISRVVELLPFVPVTATTGMRGTGTEGRGPGAMARSWVTSRRRVLRPSASRAAAAAIACEMARRRQGNATTARSPSADDRNVRRGAGIPSATWRSATQRPASLAIAAACPGSVPANSSFTAGRTKKRFGPSSTRSSPRSTPVAAPGRLGMAGSILTRPCPATVPRPISPSSAPASPGGLDRYLAELEALVAIDSGSYSPDGVNRCRRSGRRRPGRAGRPDRAAPAPAGRRRAGPGGSRGGSPRWRWGSDPAHRAHGHRLRSGDRRPASIPARGRSRHRPRDERHEGRAARRTARAAGAHGRRRATRGDLRRQPGRGDRLSLLDAAHQTPGPRARSRPGARMRARQRRHRQRPEGDRRPAADLPRSRGPCRRRAGKGSQRDPGRRASGPGAPRPERPLARA